MTPPRILAVDDEPDVLLSLRLMLELDGYEVIATASAREGLAVLETSPPDAVILDGRLPDVGGLEVLRIIKAPGHPAATVPVIVASGDADEANQTDFMAAGAVAFILKPFRAHTLLDLLGGLLAAPDPG